MTDNQPQILAELRQMVSSGNGIDEQAFRRIMLATMAGMYEIMADQKDHSHPEFEVYSAQIKALDARDWRVIVTGIVAAASAGILAYFAPHK